MTQVATVESISKSEYAYREIRQAIIENQLPTGTPLSIRDLAAQLNVSRTPVKEAINRLAYEGYADLWPDRPAMVSKISYPDILELLEMRECIEGSTAFFAATRRTQEDIHSLATIKEHHKNIPLCETTLLSQVDNQFHLQIASIAHNGRMLSSLDNILQSLSRASLSISKSDERLQRSRLQHDAIFNAIQSGDAEIARWHMTKHIQDIMGSIQNFQRDNIHLFR